MLFAAIALLLFADVRRVRAMAPVQQAFACAVYDAAVRASSQGGPLCGA